MLSPSARSSPHFTECKLNECCGVEAAEHREINGVIREGFFKSYIKMLAKFPIEEAQ